MELRHTVGQDICVRQDIASIHPSIRSSIQPPASETARQAAPPDRFWHPVLAEEDGRRGEGEESVEPLMDQMQPVILWSSSTAMLVLIFFFFSALERGPALCSPLTLPQASFATWQ